MVEQVEVLHEVVETPEIVDIKDADLQQLLSLLNDSNTLGRDFDRWSTEEVLSRLDVLESTDKAFSVQAEQVAKLRSHCRFFLRHTHSVQRDELESVTDHDDLYERLKLKKRDYLSLEEFIALTPSAKDSEGNLQKVIREYSAGDLLGIKQKEREWLLHPLLKQESSAMLYADAGVGKTWLSWEMIVTVAGGGEFAGWKADKPRRVLVVDGEMNASELKERLKAVLDRRTTEEAKRAVDNITIIPRQAQHWQADFYDLDKAEYQNKLLKRLDEAREDGNPYEMLVLDNFSCLADVEDENSSSAFNGICQFLNRAKTMTTVLLVHHTKKNAGAKASSDEGMTYRGSSKLGGIMEVCIGLSKPKPSEKPQHRGAAFKLTLEKYRGLRDELTDPRIFSLDPEGSKWDIQASESDKYKALIDALESHKYTTLQEVADALGVHKSTVSRDSSAMTTSNVMSEADLKDCYRIAKELRKLQDTPDDDIPDFSIDTGGHSSDSNGDY